MPFSIGSRKLCCLVLMFVEGGIQSTTIACYILSHLFCINYRFLLVASTGLLCWWKQGKASQYTSSQAVVNHMLLLIVLPFLFAYDHSEATRPRAGFLGGAGPRHWKAEGWFLTPRPVGGYELNYIQHETMVRQHFVDTAIMRVTVFYLFVNVCKVRV